MVIAKLYEQYDYSCENSGDLMILVLLNHLRDENELNTISKDTKIALSTLQNLYENKASSINLSTMDKLMKYFKIRNTSEIISYINENESKYDNSKYEENEYE